MSPIPAWLHAPQNSWRKHHFWSGRRNSLGEGKGEGEGRNCTPFGKRSYCLTQLNAINTTKRYHLPPPPPTSPSPFSTQTVLFSVSIFQITSKCLRLSALLPKVLATKLLCTLWLTSQSETTNTFAGRGQRLSTNCCFCGPKLPTYSQDADYVCQRIVVFVVRNYQHTRKTRTTFVNELLLLWPSTFSH